jgi:transcriptional regulator with XRE-family HTH domain
MTQAELAEASGIAEITIRQYEADKFKPKIEQMEKLAPGLNVASSEINTNNFWINAEGNLTVSIPNFNYVSYKKTKEKNLAKITSV